MGSAGSDISKHISETPFVHITVSLLSEELDFFAGLDVESGYGIFLFVLKDEIVTVSAAFLNSPVRVIDNFRYR